MRTLINARNRTVGVECGVIVEAAGTFDAVIEAPDADVRPGLINAHEHLHRNHYGRLGKPPYRNASEWAADIQHRYCRRIAQRHRRPRRDALLDGAWKNLFSGVTTVVHHDRWEPDFDRSFPLRVARVASADCVERAEALDSSAPYCLHVAEGTDDKARGEIAQLESRGLLTSNLIAVHGVGFDPPAIERFHNSGAALAWCPSSNMFMLGRTASSALLDSGVDVLLGSDSLLTGAGNLLDELRFARAHGPLDEAALERSVGTTAASRLGLTAPSLDPGAAADLILVRAPITSARASDVSLVMVGGVPRVAAPELTPMLGAIAERGSLMTVGSVRRWTNIDTAGEL
jgi:cytosine/adenosine deaminase-related metal-dependent hydrolase